MLEITIKDTESGKVLERTTELAEICACADEGVYAMILGHGKSTDISTLAWALDGTRDAMLKNSDSAKALYLLKDLVGSQTQIGGLAVDCFSDR